MQKSKKELATPHNDDAKQYCKTIGVARATTSLGLRDIPLVVIHRAPPSGSIIESVDSICRDSTDTQYMLIQANFSKSPKQLTYKPS